MDYRLMEAMVSREDFNLPEPSPSFRLPQTSFRGSNNHPHVLFLFCTCGWMSYCTRHEYHDDYDEQITVAINVLESHFSTHLYPTIEKICRPFVISSLPQNPSRSELLAQQRWSRKSTAAISSVFPPPPLLASNEKPLTTF